MLEILGYGLCGLLVLIGTIPVFVGYIRPGAYRVRLWAWMLLFCVAVGVLLLGVAIHDQADQARQAVHSIAAVS